MIHCKPAKNLILPMNYCLWYFVLPQLFFQTEPEPFIGGGHVSLNAFGFGGSNAHCIFLPNDKEEIEERGLLTFYISSRTGEGLREMVKLVTGSPSKGTFIRLLL